jgi:hypothetical protein
MLALLTPQAVTSGLKLVARPLIYLACIWLVWSWHDAEISKAEKARDMRWLAQIEAANARVAQIEAEKARAAAQASAALAAQREDYARQLSDLEARNAALPNRDRPAFGVDRRRLLFTPRPDRVSP